jgi:hypothetical protein
MDSSLFRFWRLGLRAPLGLLCAALGCFGLASSGYAGDGLLATYFSDMNLASSVGTQTDPTVNFDWGNGGPAILQGQTDQFSVRWAGYINIPSQGTYTFVTTSDDGVRLYIDGNNVINDWTDHGPTDDSAAVSLTAGSHSITMEYYENGGGATARLSWILNGSQQVIDQGYLSTSPQSSGSPPPAPTATGGTNATTSSFAANWTGSSGATGYSVDLSTSSGFSSLIYNGLSVSGTSYTFTGLSSGQTYYYRVRATNSYGASGYSNTSSGTTTSSSSGSGGLTAQYYQDTSLSSLVGTESDPTVNFNWGTGGPAILGGQTDGFSVRWSGYVVIPTAGSYTFITTSDDGVRLWVNNTKGIDDWSDHGATDDSYTVSLNAGSYPITMEYYEAGGGATAQLSWIPAGGSRAIIPQSQLSTTPGSGGTSGNGTGLRGDYYNGSNFDTFFATQTDGAVNFDWGTGGPAVLAGAVDNFSIRWTGQVQPRYSETYTFSTVSDDGAALWINGANLVNNWTDHGATTDTASIVLTAGQKYDIKMEYYERGGGATAKLYWQSASQAQEIVPASQLYPAAGGTVPAITGQPSSQTVTVGGTAAFAVTATGSTPLSYQWYKDGSAVPGATSGTYSISNVQTSNGGNYWVVVSNPYGNATSATVSLTVTAAPYVTLNGATYYRYDDTGSLTTVNVAGGDHVHVGDMVRISSSASGGTNTLIGHNILVERPSLPAESKTLEGQTNDFWGGTISSYSLAAPAQWCHLGWDLTSDAYLNSTQGAFYKSPNTVNSNRDGDFSLVLDAPSASGNPWQVIATATYVDANGNENLYTGIQPLANVDNLPLSSSVASTSRFNRANADDKLVGAYWNPGQPLGGYPGQGVWNRRWLMYGNETSLTGSPTTVWGANQLYPIISDTAGSSVLSRDVDSVEYAKRSAIRLADAGVDFVVFDYTNTSTWPNYDHADDVLRAARNAQQGFQQAATGHKIRTTMLMGLTSQWTGREYTTAKANFLDNLNYIYASLANDSAKWLYVNNKPLLLLYSGQEGPELDHDGAYGVAPSTPITLTPTNGGSGATAYVSSYNSGGIDRITVTNGGSGYTSAPTVTFGGTGTGATAWVALTNGQITGIYVLNAGSGYATALPWAPNGTSPSNDTTDANRWGTLNSSYLRDLVLINGLRIDQAFEIRYVGSLLSYNTDPHPDNLANYTQLISNSTNRYVKTGHWIYIDYSSDIIGSVLPSNLPNPVDSTPTNGTFEAITVRPRYAEIGGMRDPKRFYNDLIAAKNRAPKFLLLLAWNEYGDPNDEQSAAKSWTIGDNNKQGDTYVRIVKNALSDYK